jgi:hypothetical protein
MNPSSMRTLLSALLLLPAAAFGATGLTIYNADFAVVRDTVPLDLKAGVNEVTYEGATLRLEPDSVILRDPAGKPLQILEQNYRNDPVSQSLLLSLFEGKEIDFLIRETTKPDRTVRGKIIRSGYVPALNGNPGGTEPVIEIDGTIRFGLPGEPVFPSLGDGTILKPRLTWLLNTPKDLRTEAELGYVTGGLSWQASYNLVSPEKGDTIDLVGWITMENRSGRDFADARIKLMAGDVNKVAPDQLGWERNRMAKTMSAAMAGDQDQVTEKAFDEFHLYSLARPATLRNNETKQVEFIRATGIRSETIYVYDGAQLGGNAWRGADGNFRLTNSEFGTQSQTKVAVMREFKNSKENNLGLPLPKGRVRFYRTDGDQLEFTGENQIDHTPADELVKLYTGDAFDLVGERKRIDFRIDSANKTADESFEITLRNRKKEPVQIRVVEHLYRAANWEIREKSDPFTKVNSDEIEFRIDLKPGDERKVTYSVHYTW